ncbi:hypothetical protein ACFLRQ_03135, partial [Bacteroidota bacterium]
MKTHQSISLLLCAILLFSGCEKGNEDKTGYIEFKTMNPMASVMKSNSKFESIRSNPPLLGDTTITETTSFMMAVGDVWVSQDEVKAGQEDNLEWVRLTSSTNREHKLFENYSFSAIKIPAGTYNSIKITFRNVFYRYAQLVDDPSVAYELLETMGSWTAPCDINDTTWAKTNYFGPDGNHSLNPDGLFELVSEGEKIGGFVIEEAKTAIVSWRLWAGATEPCITYLIDENDNLIWDCGTDRMDFECPPDIEYMWDFVVEYE